MAAVVVVSIASQIRLLSFLIEDGYRNLCHSLALMKGLVEERSRTSSQEEQWSCFCQLAGSEGLMYQKHVFAH
jgi:hypothetical protein